MDFFDGNYFNFANARQEKDDKQLKLDLFMLHTNGKGPCSEHMAGMLLKNTKWNLKRGLQNYFIIYEELKQDHIEILQRNVMNVFKVKITPPIASMLLELGYWNTTTAASFYYWYAKKIKQVLKRVAGGTNVDAEALKELKIFITKDQEEGRKRKKNNKKKKRKKYKKNKKKKRKNMNKNSPSKGKNNGNIAAILPAELDEYQVIITQKELSELKFKFRGDVSLSASQPPTNAPNPPSTTPTSTTKPTSKNDVSLNRLDPPSHPPLNKLNTSYQPPLNGEIPLHTLSPPLSASQPPSITPNHDQALPQPSQPSKSTPGEAVSSPKSSQPSRSTSYHAKALATPSPSFKHSQPLNSTPYDGIASSTHTQPSATSVQPSKSIPDDAVASSTSIKPHIKPISKTNNNNNKINNNINNTICAQSNKSKPPSNKPNPLSNKVNNPSVTIIKSLKSTSNNDGALNKSNMPSNKSNPTSSEFNTPSGTTIKSLNILQPPLNVLQPTLNPSNPPSIASIPLPTHTLPSKEATYDATPSATSTPPSATTTPALKPIQYDDATPLLKPTSNNDVPFNTSQLSSNVSPSVTLPSVTLPSVTLPSVTLASAIPTPSPHSAIPDLISHAPAPPLIKVPYMHLKMPMLKYKYLERISWQRELEISNEWEWEWEVSNELEWEWEVSNELEIPNSPLDTPYLPSVTTNPASVTSNTSNPSLTASNPPSNNDITLKVLPIHIQPPNPSSKKPNPPSVAPTPSLKSTPDDEPIHSNLTSDEATITTPDPPLNPTLVIPTPSSKSISNNDPPLNILNGSSKPTLNPISNYDTPINTLQPPTNTPDPPSNKVKPTLDYDTTLNILQPPTNTSNPLIKPISCDNATSPTPNQSSISTLYDAVQSVAPSKSIPNNGKQTSNIKTTIETANVPSKSISNNASAPSKLIPNNGNAPSNLQTLQSITLNSSSKPTSKNVGVLNAPSITPISSPKPTSKNDATPNTLQPPSNTPDPPTNTQNPPSSKLKPTSKNDMPLNALQPPSNTPDPPSNILKLTPAPYPPAKPTPDYVKTSPTPSPPSKPPEISKNLVTDDIDPRDRDKYKMDTIGKYGSGGGSMDPRDRDKYKMDTMGKYGSGGGNMDPRDRDKYNGYNKYLLMNMNDMIFRLSLNNWYLSAVGNPSYVIAALTTLTLNMLYQNRDSVGCSLLENKVDIKNLYYVIILFLTAVGYYTLYVIAALTAKTLNLLDKINIDVDYGITFIFSKQITSGRDGKNYWVDQNMITY